MNSSEPWILASDIDNTLTGDDQALRWLAARLATEQARGALFLILSTGRRRQRPARAQTTWGLYASNGHQFRQATVRGRRRGRPTKLWSSALATQVGSISP